jgi:hypothetical protein
VCRGAIVVLLILLNPHPETLIAMSQPTRSVPQYSEGVNDLEISPEDKRDQDIHFEHDLKATEFSENQLKSELDTLPLMKSIWAFRRVFLLCTIAGFTASTDGKLVMRPRPPPAFSSYS